MDPEKLQTNLKPTAVNRLLGYSELLTSPRKADIWFTLWTQQQATAPTLQEHTNLPTSTLHEYLTELRSLGTIQRDTSAEPYQYSPLPVQLTIVTPDSDSEYTTGVELIGVRASARTNPDVNTFISRQGNTALQDAINAMYDILLNGNYGITPLHTQTESLTEADSALVEDPIRDVLATVAQHPTTGMEYSNRKITLTD